MPDSSVNICLMGPRASGKSTVGRALAIMLGRPFLDLDDLTLKSFGNFTSVAQAWRMHGEAKWREREAEALTAALELRGQVIALGGGTPIMPAARARLNAARQAGTLIVVYLQTTTSILQARLVREAGDRPALRGGSVVDEVEAVLKEREPTYLALADHCIDAAGEAHDIATAIAARLRLLDE